MLSKNRRLNLKRDFKWVMGGEHKETTAFKLAFRLGGSNIPLVGIAVSGRFFKKATDRNRARRKTSAAIENLYADLRNQLNLVIIPKIGILEKGQADLIEELKNVPDLYQSN